MGTQLDTMANPHFQELELSHSDFIYKGGVSLLPSAVTVCSSSNKDEDGEGHKPKAKTASLFTCILSHDV